MTDSSLHSGAPRILRAELAQGLYELCFSPIRQALYVASAGGRGDQGEASRILELDPDTLDVRHEIALPGKGFSLALDDAAGRLYAGDTLAARVFVIDLSTRAVSAILDLKEGWKPQNGEEKFPWHLRQLCLDPARNRLYATGTSFTNSALFILDTKAMRLETLIPGLGFVATGLALDAARDEILVSNMQGEVIRIDTRTDQITQRIQTGGDQLLNLAVDAAGGRIFATDQGHEFFASLWKEWLPEYQRRGPGSEVLILDQATGAGLARIATGEGPIAVLYAAAQNRICVTSRVAGQVSIFDGTDYRLLEAFAIQAHPNSLALDAAGGRLFVTVKNDESNAGNRESVVSIRL